MEERTMQTETNTTRVAVISIIVENPERVNDINDILHTAAPHIIGRMGIPYRETTSTTFCTQPRRISSAEWAFPTAKKTSVSSALW